MSKKQDKYQAPKPDDCDDCTATFTSVSADSAFINDLQIGEYRLPENEAEVSPGPSLTVSFDCDDTSTPFDLINNNADDAEDDDRVIVKTESGEEVFSGADTGINFDLLQEWSQDGEINLVLYFEDNSLGPDAHVDNNDMVVLVDINCEDDEKPGKIKSNAGRGNGAEVDENGNDIDPGNSGGHNQGGDFGPADLLMA